MSYQNHFDHADEVFRHLSSFIHDIDPILAAKYMGFAAVACITVYELAIKEILIEFSRKKHVVLGILSESMLGKINGRIVVDDIRNSYIKKFGVKYLDKFNKELKSTRDVFLSQNRRDITTSYNNLVLWRNQFAHNGVFPTQPTFDELYQNYEDGKEIIHCLFRSMKR